jgi:EAL domain-containing protein (putative c-di-GMP-specific phosphodiesterase class I)
MLKMVDTRRSLDGDDPLEQLLRPGGLTLLWQPIMDLRRAGGMIHGLECFARGPKGTPLYDPRAFSAYVRHRFAEIEVDRATVAQALCVVQGIPGEPRFTINVHARTLLEHSTFTGFLLDGLQRYGIDPSRVTVDVLRARNLAALADVLEGLRSVKISVAIDEVGVATTDYEHLSDSRPDYLKVDRTFVRKNPPDYLRDVMLESVVRLARGMGAQAVAEGVESLDELDAAMSNGINLVQGSFFAEPMTVPELMQSGLLRAAQALSA